MGRHHFLLQRLRKCRPEHRLNDGRLTPAWRLQRVPPWRLERAGSPPLLRLQFSPAAARSRGRPGPWTAPGAPRDRPQRDQLSALLREHGGNVAAVARILGKARMEVHRWVKRFDLSLADYR